MYVGLYECVQAKSENDADRRDRDSDIGLFAWLSNLLKSIFSPAGN